MDHERKILNIMKDHAAIQEKMIEAAPIIVDVVESMVEACQAGKKVVWFGNGGSAADAQHLSTELVSRFYREREAIPSIAFTTNTSTLTAISNDYSYDAVFQRQVEALVNEGDIVVGISTSGNSPNVINGLIRAKVKKAVTIGMTGRGGGRMADIVDFLIPVPSSDTPRIQEIHIEIGHIICQLLEESLSPRGD